ncbi:MAG: hypothetical protein QG629_320 [Patescibacteria group bacterium]|nr:hypothetical protein [Candidatus Saccharibacteria bacterium]MDQ5963238.1 hypothetical protein [Patescibacteria group bacterium]
MQDVKPSNKVTVQNKDEDTSVKNAPRDKAGVNKVVAIVAVVLALLGLLGTAVFYKKYQSVKTDPTSAQKAQNSAETQRVLTKLKKVLRVDETQAPTVARVEDPTKLKKANAEFYKNVEKGDYLVIFPKRAVIYRDSVDQIINIAPIINTGTTADKATKPAAGNPTTQPTATPAASNRQ